MIKLGGIGDCADAVALANGIKRKYHDSTLTAYVNSETGAHLLQPPVFDCVRIAREPWHQTVENQAWMFDKFFDFRPYTAAILHGNYYEKTATIETLKEKEKTPYQNMLTVETNKLQELGKNVVALSAEAADIEASYDNVLALDTPSLNGKFPDHFVTVHLSADNTNGNRNQNTKLWYIDQFQALVQKIKQERNTAVYQLGIETEQVIEGTASLLGKHSILETAAILKKSSLHIDIEGGLVRVRRLMTSKPSVVLFGPTPISLFGFSNNINISANICHPCVWMSSDWMQKCYLGWNQACMQGITAEAVFQRIEEANI